MRLVIALSFAAALAAAPLAAQESEAEPPGEIAEGFSLMEEGAKLLMRGLAEEMEPALEELQDMAREIEPALRAFAAEMGPALTELMRLVDEIRYYEVPEVLPNGDIILRRRDDAPPYVAPPGEETEL